MPDTRRAPRQRFTSTRAISERPLARYPVLLLLGATLFSQAAFGKPAVLRIGFAGDPASSARRGAELGVTESNRQGRYFEKELRLESEFPPEASAPELWIAALEGDDLLEHIHSEHLVIAATATYNSLRAACLPNVFFALPSRAMARRALARAPEDVAKGAAAEAWHPSLIKYAARDLNKRYREAFGEPMDSHAWAGWAAARIYGEAWTRGAGPEPAGIIEYLRDKLSFDGQKGVAMTFAPSGQLRQVMFLVKDDQVVGEVPIGRDAPTLIRELVSPVCETVEPAKEDTP